MALILILIISAFVTSINANIKIVFLSDLCPRKPGGEAQLLLGSVRESFNSTAIIQAAPLKIVDKYHELGYDYDTHCILKVHSPPEHHVVASLKKVQFRELCADNLTIYADDNKDKKETFCASRTDVHETTTVTSKGVLNIEFISGPYSEEEIMPSPGFQLTVTAYTDGTCDTTTEFSCKNGRCIAGELNCSIHNHCGDNSNQMCGAVTNTSNTCGGHRFPCANGNCINNRYICDEVNDCGDFSDENVCGNCSKGMFACRNGKCLNNRLVCDKHNDCEDWSDEDNCSYACWVSNEFTCTNRRCIWPSLVCNKENDCGDNSDEANCIYTCSPRRFTCKNGNCIGSYLVCNKNNDCGDWSDEENCHYTCSPYHFTCRNGSCILSYQVCDRRNDCGDWSDEENCNYTCAPYEFTCDNGNCVSSWKLCDREDDCGDGSDEQNCTYTCPSYQNTCNNGNCYSTYQICDGNDDCGDGTDEENCPTAMSTGVIFAITLSASSVVLIICGLVIYFLKKRNATIHHQSPYNLSDVRPGRI